MSACVEMLCAGAYSVVDVCQCVVVCVQAVLDDISRDRVGWLVMWLWICVGACVEVWLTCAYTVVFAFFQGACAIFVI